MDLTSSKNFYLLLIQIVHDYWFYRPGGCPPPVTMAGGFNATKFSGVWYEFQANSMVRLFNVCVMHRFDNDNGEYSVKSIEVTSRNTVFWNATYTARYDTANLDVTPKDSGNKYTYNIVDTDYDNYALMYTCDHNFGLYSIRKFYVLSRAKKLRDRFKYKTDELFESLGVNITLIAYTDQSNCTSEI